MKLELSRGLFTEVDQDDYTWLSQWKWSAMPARCKKKKYYAVRAEKVNGKYKTIYLHREIMNAKPGQEVDHVNSDSLDNRKSNLRIVDRKKNAYGNGLVTVCRGGGQKTSPFKGVYVDGRDGKIKAVIHKDGKSVYLGTFETHEEGARVYDAHANKLFGKQYAMTNARMGLI